LIQGTGIWVVKLMIKRLIIDGLYTYVYNQKHNLSYTFVYKMGAVVVNNELEEKYMGEGYHRGRRHKGKDGMKHRGPKTFRRGRAISFLERMICKRSTIQQQLDKPEFQSIQQVLIGELKAIDMVIAEFTQLFEIQESDLMEISEGQSEEVEKAEENHIMKGNELNETN